MEEKSMMSAGENDFSWNHYQILIRIDNLQARSFYEIEAYNQQWSVRCSTDKALQQRKLNEWTEEFERQKEVRL
ncbi:MAG: hypothetical protein MJZ24_06065 [Paludibacteraceae bacterium]|nr:hypothetical protein [Paludibacteraceae bacterium]